MRQNLLSDKISEMSKISALKKTRNYRALTVTIIDIQSMIANLNTQKNVLLTLQISIEKDIKDSRKKK